MPATKRVAHTLKPAPRTAKPKQPVPLKLADITAIEKDAAMRRVKERLARIDEMRDARRLADAGKTQREVADILRITQPRVHRMLKATEGRNVEDQSPEEIILLAAANATPRNALVRRLSGLTYTFRQRAPEPFEGAVSGSWDEVRLAYTTGLLSDGEFERVRDAVKPPSS